MRYHSVRCIGARRRHRGSVLLVVLGVLTVLSLIGLSFVLLTRTESSTARNYRHVAEAELLVHSEIDRIRAILLGDLYPNRAEVSGTTWRLWGESHDYPNEDDGWLFGLTGDGSGVLQVSFGGQGTPTVDNDTRDTPQVVLDSAWQNFTLSNGLLARKAALVIDHGGLANLNTWGNRREPTVGGHNTHQGLGPFELNLMRTLGLDPSSTDQLDTYQAMFIGRGLHAGRYGAGNAVAPGQAGVDDDGDTGAWRNGRDDDVNGTVDEDSDENLDEPDEYCYANPGGTGADRDRPFDLVDLWELLHDDEPFRSRLEVILGVFDLDDPFDAGAPMLGSYRRNLTTLSADPQWVGVGAADVANRLQVRLDLNHATLDELQTAFLQAGFSAREARQLTVNAIDSRDADDNVTRDDNGTPLDPTDDIYGHERQPYVNEVFIAMWRPPGFGPPPGHGPPDGHGWRERVLLAVELHNPYDTEIDLYRWELRIDIEGDTPSSQVVAIDDTQIQPNGYVTLISADTGAPASMLGGITGDVVVLGGANFLTFPLVDHVYRLRLVRACQTRQRPDPATGDELVVDDTGSAISFSAASLPSLPPRPEPPGPPPGALAAGLDLFRRDAEVNLFEEETDGTPPHTLGEWNDPADTAIRYGVPIPNRGGYSFSSVASLGELLDHTQNGNQPYTDDYALMNPQEKEKGIKFDLSGDWYQGGGDPAADYNKNRHVLDLFCVNRPDHDGLDNDADGAVDEADEAQWPIYGRININTASQAMLERALCRGPYDTSAAKEKATVLASEIVKRRETVGPFTHIGDLFRGADLAAAMAHWAEDGVDNDADGVGAEPGEEGEKDERDARFRFLANLVTTRSNVFTVFVAVEIYRDADDNGTIEEDRDERMVSRKAIAVLDRSLSAMTVKYDGTTRVPHIASPVILRHFRWISD